MSKNLEAMQVVQGELNKGNLVIPSIAGNYLVSLEGFSQQSIEGLLYDLDLMEEQLDYTTVQGIQRYAIAQVIRYLHSCFEKEQLDAN